MNIIDFRFRPSTPDAVQGMLNNKVFGGMYEQFKYADRAKPEPIEKIVADMEKQGVVKGVVTGRDAETTYGLGSSNPGIVARWIFPSSSPPAPPRWGAAPSRTTRIPAISIAWPPTSPN